MHPTITYLTVALKNYQKILTQSDKDLITEAVGTIWGNPIYGDVGEFPYLQGVEENGSNNEAKVLQLITNYIIWCHSQELKRVSKWGYLPEHPLQEFMKQHSELVRILPSVIKHYVSYQDWVIDPYGMDDIADYLPKPIERVANIE